MKKEMLNTASTNKTRNSSIEILRIIAMLFIVISHFSVHGVQDFTPLYELKPCFNKYMLESIQLGDLGVDIFIMITGYFNVKSVFKTKKLFKLILQVIFYSVSIFIILSATGFIDFSIFKFIKAFFPASFKTYWFFSSYILIYILSPFINKYLNGENRKNHLALIVILWFVFRIISLLNDDGFFNNHFTDLFVLYLIGAYLRLYPDNIFNKKNNAMPVLIIVPILMLASVGAMNIVSKYIPSLEDNFSFFYRRMSSLIIIFVSSLLTVFTKINIRSNKLINTVSSCTFGVYLIHDNPYMRKFLWSRLFCVRNYVYSNELILYVIFVPLIIFIVCTIIDLLRQKTIEVPVVSVVNYLYDKTKQKVSEIYDKKCYKSR